MLLGLDIVEGADFQLGAVGGKAAGQGRGHARAQVTADDGRAHQADLRLLLLEQVHEDVGMRGGGIREEFLAVKDEEFVHAIREDLVFHLALDAGTGDDGVQLDAQLIGQFTALGQ